MFTPSGNRARGHFTGIETIVDDRIVFRKAYDTACACVAVFGVGQKYVVQRLTCFCKDITRRVAVADRGVLRKTACNTACAQRAAYVPARVGIMDIRGRARRNVGGYVPCDTACVQRHTFQNADVYVRGRIYDFGREVHIVIGHIEGLLIANQTAGKAEIIVIAVQVDFPVCCRAKVNVCAHAVADQTADGDGTVCRHYFFGNACVDGEVVQLNAVEQTAARHTQIRIYRTEQTNVVCVCRVDGKVGDGVRLHFTRIRVGVAGKATAEEGVFGGHIPDDLQFFTAAVDVVGKHVCTRHVFVYALVYLFGDIQKVDGLGNDERIVEFTRTCHVGNCLLHTRNGDFDVFRHFHVVSAVIVGGDCLAVDVYDGIARVEGAHFYGEINRFTYRSQLVFGQAGLEGVPFAFHEGDL